MDRDKMSNLYKGPSIDASYQVSVHLAEGFQRKRLKCEKLTDNKLWQKDSKKKVYRHIELDRFRFSIENLQFITNLIERQLIVQTNS
jgi:hypothetical protein